MAASLDPGVRVLDLGCPSQRWLTLVIAQPNPANWDPLVPRGLALPVSRWAASVQVVRYFGPVSKLDISFHHQTWRLRATMEVPERGSGIATRVMNDAESKYPRHSREEQAWEECSTRLRYMLHLMAQHEVDECIQVDGRRVFDPHRK